MSLKKRGTMVILSSPSGAGKTTLVKLLSEKKNFYISVSHTTRTPRPNEINGIDYFFINKKSFQKLVDENEFLEFAKVFDNYYGTSKKNVIKKLNDGNNVIFDIDWQGTEQIIKEKLDFKLVTIFILPPSKKELIKRLKVRGRDTQDEMKKRMNLVQNEISHFPEYDYVVINQDLKKCVNKIKNIIDSERQKKSRLINLTNFINKFRG